jgi:hypothetical protein
MSDLKKLITGAAVVAVFWLWGHGHQTPTAHSTPARPAASVSATAHHATR